MLKEGRKEGRERGGLDVDGHRQQFQTGGFITAPPLAAWWRLLMHVAILGMTFTLQLPSQNRSLSKIQNETRYLEQFMHQVLIVQMLSTRHISIHYLQNSASNISCDLLLVRHSTGKRQRSGKGTSVQRLRPCSCLITIPTYQTEVLRRIDDDP